MNYDQFLESKSQLSNDFGFDAIFLPDALFDFQRHLVEWAIKKGRAAIFADCGLGKSLMSLTWCQNIVERTNGNTLIITPLAVSHQFIREADKFGLCCTRSGDGNPAGRITVTNYERLHLFNPSDFEGVVCDESSIIKNYKGATKSTVIEFLRRMPYRLLCTATAAPNDYIELGTSSEALGYMGAMDMLGYFFKNNEKSLHPAFIDSSWTFKPHAEMHFWRWVSSWAKAIRKPSDLGFPDDGFDLPPITVNERVIDRAEPLPGALFALPAVGLKEQRQERRMTITDRCEKVAEICEDHDCTVSWAHLNDEANLLSEMIPDSVNISGSNSDEEKEEAFMGFSDGDIKRLITKPRIGAFGMNWQHCNHMTTFPSHSYEQYYQSVRRIWRFGQTRPVTVDVVMSPGESRVFNNLARKAEAAEKMFVSLIAHMKEAQAFHNQVTYTETVEVPSWL